jgi:hypothetical protein
MNEGFAPRAEVKSPLLRGDFLLFAHPGTWACRRSRVPTGRIGKSRIAGRIQGLEPAPVAVPLVVPVVGLPAADVPPVALPPAAPGPACANAKVLVNASAPANAIVENFMVVSSLFERS